MPGYREKGRGVFTLTPNPNLKKTLSPLPLILSSAGALIGQFQPFF
jgi:hypothetical protein